MAQGTPRRLGEVLAQVLTRLARESGAAKPLGPVWEQVAGPAIARASRPLQVEGGTLRVEVQDAQWQATLAAQERELARRLEQACPGLASRLSFEVKGR